MSWEVLTAGKKRDKITGKRRAIRQDQRKVKKKKQNPVRLQQRT